LQISLYDIYLEVCPTRLTGEEAIPDPNPYPIDELDDIEENEYGDEDENVMKFVRWQNSPPSVVVNTGLLSTTSNCITSAKPRKSMLRSSPKTKSRKIQMTTSTEKNGSTIAQYHLSKCSHVMSKLSKEAKENESDSANLQPQQPRGIEAAAARHYVKPGKTVLETSV
jgi:hypothetical protein